MTVDEELFTIPDVVGLEAQQAREILLQDFNPSESLVFQTSEVVSAGKVLATSPSAGELAPRNTTIFLTVSAGHEPTGIVPTVAGMSADNAKAALEFEHYGVIRHDQPSATVEPEIAIGTLPRAGTAHEPGRDVTLIVSIGVPPFEPDLSQPGG
jgi:serine/threonine-protein kinase